MTKALEFLKETNEDLYEKAVGGKKFQNVNQVGNTNARLEGLVPREMRIPMERPSTDLWDSTWTAPKLVE